MANGLQCVAVCHNVLQCVAVCRSVLQCVAIYHRVLQRVAVCCSVLQYTLGYLLWMAKKTSHKNMYICICM